MLADRDRIARDLHEHVIGRLFGIGLALHGTQRLAKSPAVAARIAEHIEHLNQVITEIRTAVFDLHTDPADTRRLGGLLHRHRRARSPPTPTCAPRSAFSGRIDIVPADLAEHAQAVLREAVSNTVRHAHATELTVTITVGADLRHRRHRQRHRHPGAPSPAAACTTWPPGPRGRRHLHRRSARRRRHPPGLGRPAGNATAGSPGAALRPDPVRAARKGSLAARTLSGERIARVTRPSRSRAVARAARHHPT